MSFSHVAHPILLTGANERRRTGKALNTQSLLLILVVFCVFSFKVVLLPIGEAGIRIDDVLICVAIAWLGITGQLQQIRLSPAIKLYCAFICVGIGSALWNGLLGRVHTLYSLTFVFRQAEYMAFFYFGHFLKSKTRRFSQALLVYTGALAIVVPAQMLGLVPVPGHFGTLRASGNTNGPYELAAVSAFLMCYLGYGQRKKLSPAIAAIFIVLSAARITFVAIVISFARYLYSRSKYRISWVLTIVTVSVAGTIALLALPRIAELAPLDNSSLMMVSRFADSTIPIDEIRTIYDAAPTFSTSSEYFVDMFTDATTLAQTDSGDVSGMIRVYRWTTLIKTTLSTLDSTIIGLGPSFGTVAVDGYFVRLFVETGVIGLIAFILFLRALISPTPNSPWPFREYVLTLAITACFIDIFVAYKPMLLLWLWHGMSQKVNKHGTV